MKRPSLPAMQAFRRVVELHSFGAAARSLEMTGGAVSKLVAQLERDLGVRLLHRTTRSVTVSTEGLAFYEDAVRILEDVDTSSEALRNESSAPSGRVKVSLPTSFAICWLASRLPAFMRDHPQIELDVVLSDRYVDIVQEGFDCAIRIASRLPDSSLVARRLGGVQRLLVAAPSYLNVAPPLSRPQDLNAHACLVYSQDGGPAEWSLGGAAPLLLAGLGVTLTPEFVVSDLLGSGQLVELLSGHRPATHGVFGVVAHQRHVPRKVATLLDFIGSQLAQAQGMSSLSQKAVHAVKPHRGRAQHGRRP
jgi:DNA-binding transcriptional LysR family regulator